MSNEELHSFPTRRSSDLHHASDKGERRDHGEAGDEDTEDIVRQLDIRHKEIEPAGGEDDRDRGLDTENRRRGRFHRSEEHTSELQSQSNLVCRLLLEKKK